MTAKNIQGESMSRNSLNKKAVKAPSVNTHAKIPMWGNY